MKKVLTGIAVLAMFTSRAQDSTTIETNKLAITGYVEAYYGYDFNKPVDNNRPSFILATRI